MSFRTKVSVIVPVYGTQAYIHQAVDSILSQTYTNLEIILVDDCSPDRCPQICDEYAIRDPRVRVIHKENGGLTSSRYAGISAATGDYLIIVDSDDWIDADLVEQCIATAQADGADCVLYSYVKEYPQRSIPVHLFDHPFHYSAAEAADRIHRRLIGPLDGELSKPQKAEFLSSVCMKFYRIDIARRARFVSEREVGTNEDGIFNLYALEDCSVSYIDRCFYHYRKTNSNSITTQYKPGFPEKWDVMYRYLQEYLDQTGRDDRWSLALGNRIACGMITLGLNEVNSNTGLFSQAARIRAILGKPLYRSAFARLSTGPCPLPWKCFFLMCKWRLALPLTTMLRLMDQLRTRMAT